jgi:hypothetical protein
MDTAPENAATPCDVGCHLLCCSPCPCSCHDDED